MSYLFETVLSNLIVASLLALPAALAGLWGKRPALTHALWLLVMLKLITPPFFQVPIDWPAPQTTEPKRVALAPAAKVELEPVIELPHVQELPDEEPPNLPEVDDWLPMPEFAEVEPVVNPGPPIVPVALPEAEPVALASDWPWRSIVATVWLVGSALWLSIALIRLLRFERMLRHAEPASLELRTFAQQLAGDMGIHCLEMCVVPGKISPMLWALWGAPRLVLPGALIARLPADQLATMLVHELAHWRRRDDRTRWLEIIVFGLYWWCPLVWWARRELHQAEEECCDAWVVSQLPESAKAYALALVETVDFLSDAPTSLPAAASGLGHVRLLKRRLTMILNGKTPRALTLSGLLGVAGVGLLLLPMVPGWAQAPPDGGGRGAAQPREKKGDRERGEIEKLRDDVKRLQHEMEQRRNEMEKRSHEIHMLMEHLRRVEKGHPGGDPYGPMGGEGKKKGGGPGEEKKKGGPPFGPMGGEGKKKGGGPGEGGPGLPGGGPGGKPGGFGGGFPGQGGGFPGQGGFQPGGPGPRSPIDQRLNDVEQKLDQLLQEIRSMRNDMKGKQGGGGAGAGLFNPMRKFNPDNPNPGRGPGAGGPPTPPTPPMPPRPRKEDDN